jgi:hypothetical protein
MSDTAGKSPAWAPFFSPEEWALFVAAVSDDLEGREVQHSIDADEGNVRVDLPAGSRVPDVLGLQNIAQVCHARPRAAWADTIRHHFDVAFDSKDGEAAEVLAKDWSLAKTKVKVRLYGEELVPGVPLVNWPVAEGLLAVLSFDLPDTVISVRREDRANWSVDDEELFAVALANVRNAGLLHAGTVDIGARTSLEVLEGSSDFFAASHALMLEEYVGDAPHGAVVAIPHRHAIVFHRIEDLRVVRAIQQMIVSTNRMYAEGPGSISSDLYWWRGGSALVRLPCTREKDGVRFTPPHEFVELLNGLSPAPDESL